MQRVFTHTYHVPGTLAANIVIGFTVPFDCQLVHVSAVNSAAASNATLILGPSTDTNGYLESCAVGQSGVPVEKGRTDFVGSQYPHIADGTIFVATLDFDGSSGTAAADFTLVLTFTEG